MSDLVDRPKRRQGGPGRPFEAAAVPADSVIFETARRNPYCEDLAEALGVSSRTLRRWCAQRPELARQLREVLKQTRVRRTRLPRSWIAQMLALGRTSEQITADLGVEGDVIQSVRDSLDREVATVQSVVSGVPPALLLRFHEKVVAQAMSRTRS